MTKSLQALGLAVALSITAACSPSGPGGGDLGLIQGSWEMVSMTTEGKELPPDALAKDTTVTFEGDKMITKRGDKVRATWTFSLDSTTNPKRMTINRADPGEEEKLSYSIYKIDGDTLTTQGAARSYPESFTADTEKGCFLTVRRRFTVTPMEDKLRFEVVSLTPRSGNYLRVTYKVTNAADRHIRRAKATIAVLDADGNEIGSETHYVVKGADGGLAPGASAEDDFLVTVSDKEKAATAQFTIESVRGG